MATVEQLLEQAERAKARAAIAKAEAQRLQAEAIKARAAAQRAKAEEATARAEAGRRMHEVFFGFARRHTEVAEPQRNRLIKALGMLGSKYDGEALSAARKVEQLRSGLDMTWDELIASG